ncbi:uncharacterized protein LOC116045394 [Sander lucioperca]|uniref:uncharacterized protein LOC116045394 n=1 Tax=Sander lucioperca TaxID=283035 RepID=UPI0016536575|nr:uncharacterized protein LOC116045394 [Sander lucioperca]
MSSFLMLLVQFKAAAGTYSFSTVRVGDEVTFSCGNVTDDQDQCNSTDWFFTGSGNTVMLFEHGQIQEEAKAKSNRLSVTEKCSLVIKKVTLEDAGGYVCMQFRSGQQHGESTVVFLNAVTMTEEKNDDSVTLNCSVSTYEGCFYTVKWMYEGDKNDVKTTELDCSATVTFATSHLNQKSEYYELLKCKVTHYTKRVHLFPFSPPQSPGDDATTTNKSPMTTGNKRTSEETNNPTSENNNYGPGENMMSCLKSLLKWLYEGDKNDVKTTELDCSATVTFTSSHLNQKSEYYELLKCEVTHYTKRVHLFPFSPPQSPGWWRIIVMSLGLATFIPSVVAVNIWARDKGNKTQTEENIEHDDEDEGDGTVNYENTAEPSTSV